MSESIHHIAIIVSDVPRAALFYEKVFSFAPLPRLTESTSKNPGAWFRMGTAELHLQGRAKTPERTEQHFALITNQLEQICKKANALGGRVEEARQLEGFSQRCFIYDLDNNRIELLQK